jgi:hypothetical protein
VDCWLKLYAFDCKRKETKSYFSHCWALRVNLLCSVSDLPHKSSFFQIHSTSRLLRLVFLEHWYSTHHLQPVLCPGLRGSSMEILLHSYRVSFFFCSCVHVRVFTISLVMFADLKKICWVICLVLLMQNIAKKWHSAVSHSLRLQLIWLTNLGLELLILPKMILEANWKWLQILQQYNFYN